MNRRTFLKHVASTAALCMSGVSVGRTHVKANPPNIILIMADDIAYDNNQIKTSNTDKSR